MQAAEQCVIESGGPLLSILEKYNGTLVGMFPGDKCLSGIGNNLETERCSLVKLMYRCETPYQITGDRIWADLLKRIAFTALSATLTDDMCAQQYDQLVNQIACQIFSEKSFFRTNKSDACLVCNRIFTAVQQI